MFWPTPSSSAAHTLKLLGFRRGSRPPPGVGWGSSRLSLWARCSGTINRGNSGFSTTGTTLLPWYSWASSYLSGFRKNGRGFPRPNPKNLSSPAYPAYPAYRQAGGRQTRTPTSIGGAYFAEVATKAERSNLTPTSSPPIPFHGTGGEKRGGSFTMTGKWDWCGVLI